MVLAPSMVRLTFFHSADTCPPDPEARRNASRLCEPRKRRANERHVVGCCEELAGFLFGARISASPRRQTR
jgi:hypothetical protein